MAAKDTFLAACAVVGWTIADTSPALDDLAEHLFDHAVRGSDAWSRIMVRVRDAVAIAEDGGAIGDVVLPLGEATLRAQDAGVALPS